jgi:hypothetical protein
MVLDLVGYSRMAGADEERTLTELSRFAPGFRDVRFFSADKPLIWLMCDAAQRRKTVVVKTYLVSLAGDLPMMGSRHVSPLDDSQEGRQGAPLF